MTQTYIYIYNTHTYVCVCVCVCIYIYTVKPVLNGLSRDQKNFPLKAVSA